MTSLIVCVGTEKHIFISFYLNVPILLYYMESRYLKESLKSRNILLYIPAIKTYCN